MLTLNDPLQVLPAREVPRLSRSGHHLTAPLLQPQQRLRRRHQCRQITLRALRRRPQPRRSSLWRSPRRVVSLAPALALGLVLVRHQCQSMRAPLQHRKQRQGIHRHKDTLAVFASQTALRMVLRITAAATRCPATYL